MQITLPTKTTARPSGKPSNRKPSNDNSRTGFRTIALDSIDMHPRQARQKFPEEEISSLASSLETHGLIEPILVRPTPGGRYELVAGERRYRAAAMAGWTEISATVRELDDKASIEMMLVENVQRRDLDVIELARGLAQLCRAVAMGGGGLSHAECDEMFGKHKNWTARHVSLLKLPSLWQERVRTKEISYSAACALVPFADQAGVLQAIDRDMKKNPWAWHTHAEVVRSARLVSERLQAEANRKAAKAKQVFGIRTAVGDWPDGELPALCEALRALADDLAESVEAKGGAA